MKPFLKNILLPTLIGFLFILPFIIMEMVNRRNFNEGFPFTLFFALWLNLFAVVLILLPIVRARRAAGSLFAHPIHLIIAVAISLFFTEGVVSLIIDQ